MFNIPVQRKQEWILSFWGRVCFHSFYFCWSENTEQRIITFEEIFVCSYGKISQAPWTTVCILGKCKFSASEKKVCVHTCRFRRGVRVISVFSHVTGSVYKRFFTGVDLEWTWIDLNWWSSRDFNGTFYIRTSNNLVWVLEFNSFITPVMALITLPLINVLPTTFLRQAF